MQGKRLKSLDFPSNDRENYNPSATAVIQGYNSKSVKLNLRDHCDRQVYKPSMSLNVDTLSSIYDEEELEQFERKQARKRNIYSPQLEKSDCESGMSCMSAFKTVN